MTVKIVTRQEAIALGLDRYFTGKPCVNGHTSERNTKKRGCLACDRVAALRKKRLETSAQRERRLTYQFEYNIKRRERVRELSKIRYKIRREAILRYKKSYRKDNWDTISAKSKARYIKNRALELAKKKNYREQNKSAIAALAALRKKHIRQRVPKWIGPEEKWLMKEAYELAALQIGRAHV